MRHSRAATRSSATSKQMRAADEYVDVKQNHVYIIRLVGSTPKGSVYIKLKVIEHHDNDGVMFDWEPIQAGTKQSDEF